MLLGISFPDKRILELRFLNQADFYNIKLNNITYTIVGRDCDIQTNLIGIAPNEKVFYITTDDNVICYIASNIYVFIKELLLYDDYINNEENQLPENPDDLRLFEFAEKFRNKISYLDRHAFENENTYWSEVCEEMEYGY